MNTFTFSASIETAPIPESNGWSLPTCWRLTGHSPMSKRVQSISGQHQGRKNHVSLTHTFTPELVAMNGVMRSNIDSCSSYWPNIMTRPKYVMTASSRFHLGNEENCSTFNSAVPTPMFCKQILFNGGPYIAPPNSMVEWSMSWA